MSGARAISANAKASDDAVVSWPATSAVSSSSRISSSVIGEPSVCVAAEQRREDVVAVAVAVGAALGHQLVQLASTSARTRSKRANGPRPTRACWSAGQHRERAVAERQHAPAAARAGRPGAAPSSRPKTARRMISSVSACRRGCSSTGSPSGQRVELALGELLDQAGEALHAVAVEGGQQQLALLDVRALVEQDHRVRADDRLEQPRALARVQDVGRRGEDRLDVLGVGEDRRTAAGRPAAW